MYFTTEENSRWQDTEQNHHSFNIWRVGKFQIKVLLEMFTDSNQDEHYQIRKL